jgi:hypothetical protein
MGLAQTILLELEAWAHDLDILFLFWKPYTNKRSDCFISKKTDIP